MKRNLLLILAAMACMFMACSVEELADEKTLDESGLSKTEDAYTEDMQLLADWGYDTTAVRVYDEYYLVSNEFIFYKNELMNCRSVPKTRINAESIRLAREQQQIHIDKYQMDAMSNSDMLLEEAISEWNSIDDCNIFFSTTASYPGGTNAAIEVTSTPTFAFGSALVTVTPLTGNLNGRITINTGYYIWEYLDPSQRRYAIMHAIGHLIGLKDSDEFTSHVTETNDDKVNTIMRPSDEITTANVGGYWSGLTRYDKEDLSKLYPLRPIDDLEYEIYSVGDGKETKVTGRTLYTGTDYRIKIKPFESVKPMEGISYGLTVDYTDGTGTDIEKASSEDTFDITFTDTGKCDITVILYGKDGKERGTSGEGLLGYEIKEIEEELYYPSVVNVGNTYTIKWQYKHPAYPDAHVEFSIGDIHYENGDYQNITVSKKNDWEANVTLNDYGKFRVDARLVDGPSDVKDKIFYFTKLNYKPSFTIDPDLVIWDCPQSIYYATLNGFYPLPDESFDVPDGSEGPTITFEDQVLQDRVYLDYALKYYLNEDNVSDAHRLDHYLLINHIGSVMFEKGESNVQHFTPVRDVVYYYEENGSDMYKGYFPFYMAEYPEDGVKVVTAE
ncbi:MAG TPA: hypothetical protein IAC09_00605 [Candidatus Cryptobacteroides intestinipullorum]|nr:hypothetical protein [Candidatus Cryptobacteroides intestinipullorum]